MKWMYVIILEKCSYVQYFFTKKQQQSNAKRVISRYVWVVYKAFQVTGPLKGGRDADVAHGEKELDLPALDRLPHPVRLHLEASAW